ncbi:MAG: hypothetical protein ACI8UO_001264 [Verrucomicrobiales bacterium]
MKANRFFPAIAAAAIFAFGGVASAVLNEAHSMIMETAESFVTEDEFTLRHEYWDGEFESGKQKLIQHQLFRGNEYWFWVGTSIEGCKLKIEVYDDKGNSVTVERTEEGFTAGARVTPAKTGSYYILIKIESEDVDMVDWALVYAYR